MHIDISRRLVGRNVLPSHHHQASFLNSTSMFTLVFGRIEFLEDKIEL